MKLIRVIEEFMKHDNSLHKEYELNISTDKLLEILDDLELNEGDYPDEVYDSYELTKNQIERLKPFFSEVLEEDMQIYLYQLSCYEDNS